MARIIAGVAKGHRLSAPKGVSTRPTTDRVKEALFSSLSAWFGTAAEAPEDQLEGVATLDLFAGSGALGLEAASRGAAPVLCVDTHTASLIRDNARRAGLSGVTAVSRRAEQVVAETEAAFDLVFIDPPYDMRSERVDELLGALMDRHVLAEQSLVVVERSSRSTPPVWPTAFTDCWDRRYGETTLHYGATEREQT